MTTSSGFKAVRPPAAGASAPSALERLHQEPTRFSLDQAAAVIAHGRDPVEIKYCSVPRLDAPSGEVVLARVDPPQLHTPTFGLIGPGGVLPRHYTGAVAAQARANSPALQGFFDMVSGRFIGLFVKAGGKSRPSRDPTIATTVLAGAVGLGTPRLASAMVTPLPAMLHHAGALSSRTRGVERLRSMLAAESGSPVDIIEFAGGWLRLPESERTRLGAGISAGQHVRLNRGAVLGAQIWDPTSRIVIRFGPLTLAEFGRRLPGEPLHTRLAELTRLYVGMELDFLFNLVLDGPEVPRLELRADTRRAQRLGWTSWLTTPNPRRSPVASALLPPRPTTSHPSP